jgi:hypothetical protein
LKNWVEFEQKQVKLVEFQEAGEGQNTQDDPLD